MRFSSPAPYLGLALVSATAACAINDGDLARWEGTQRGPAKLYAVVTHDKYPLELRKQAVLSLIRMPPRSGRRLGVTMLTQVHKDEEARDREGALMALPAATREALLSAVLPDLVAAIDKPPVKLADGKVSDDTIPFKDAAFAILSHEPPLLADPAGRATLQAALVKWAQTGFEDRVENSTQQFGVEQMMRFLGAASTEGLPALVKEETYRVDRVAAMVADVGDDATKLQTSKALVALAEHLDSPTWSEAQRQVVEASNAQQGIKANAEQVQGQIGKIREKRFTEEVLPAMKRIGGRPVIDYLLGYAADGKHAEERRKLSLAALEGKADKNVPQDLERLFAIAKDDATPDVVRDQAFTRLGELPKEAVVPKLYGLFDSPKWKVRWVAGSMILSMIDSKELGTFFEKLPSSAKTKMGMTEGLSYGSTIAKMEAKGGPAPRDIAIAQLGSASIGAKLTAIGFFFEGAKADAAVLAPLAESKEPVPSCEAEDDCGWACEVAKTPGGTETESQEVKTIGQLVSQCIVPNLR